MTAILDDIRRLDAAHARGEITAVDLAASKAKLMDSVPDAFEEASERADLPPTRRGQNRRREFGPTLLFCAFILTVCIGTALVLTGDMTLSATLAITVLAALTVLLFRQIE